MDEFLINLRKKPLHTRRAILVVSTTAITAIIFLIWLSFWVGGANTREGGEGSEAQAPSSLLKDNWQGLTGTLKSGFSEVKNQLRF